MISFKQFLKEDEDEHHRAEVRLLTPNELQFTKESVALAKLIHEFVKKRKTLTVDDVKDMNDKLHVFNHFGFIEKITNSLSKILKSHGKMLDSADHLKANLSHIKNHGVELKKAFLKKDFAKAKHHSGELKSIIDPVDHNVDAANEAKLIINREFHNEPSFFGTTKLLDSLATEDYQEIEKIDTDKPLYTSIDFPFKKLEDDWHYVVYFLKQLKTDSTPISFTSTYDFRKYVKVAHSSDENFKKLHGVLDDYLHSNNQDLIPQIVELINLIPTIKKANDKRKAQIKTVYRGLGFGEDEYPTEANILRQEKKRKFVATSESKHVANNFALQKGHLEHEDERRSGVGYIIRYSVSPEAILFDTKIIETVFNESEILIDVTKAKFTGMEQV